MTPRKSSSSSEPPSVCFVKELAGENPPSMLVLANLYNASIEFLEAEPWRLVDETDLILTRSKSLNEMCYCSVMGALGEVYSLHCYIGDQGLRTFQRIASEQIAGPEEFFSTVRSINVEYVTKTELEPQDRQLLKWLRDPPSRGINPVFRANRPGFDAWFVTMDEALALTDCIRAVLLVLKDQKDYWTQPGRYPFVTAEQNGDHGVVLVTPGDAAEAPQLPIPLDNERLHRLKKSDLPIAGVLELEHRMTTSRIGSKYQRKAFACCSIAVDAHSGLVHAVEASDSSTPPAVALIDVFLKAVESRRALPAEVRLSTAKFASSIGPVLASCGVPVKVTKLPEARRALTALMSYMQSS